MSRILARRSARSDCHGRSYPLLPSFSARVVFLGKVSQIVVVVKIEEFHQILEGESRRNPLVAPGTKKTSSHLLVRAPLTVQNWIPLTEFPSLSRGGDQHMIPITLGTTNRIPPDTPDLAGRPTCSKERIMSKKNTSAKESVKLFWNCARNNLL